jgi:hypothetical protein
MKKCTIKKKCKCGRHIIVARIEHGPTPQPVCGICKKYGLKRSRVISLNVRRNLEKTKYR